MKTAIFALALFSSANAAPLPIDRAYGTGAGCALYSEEYWIDASQEILYVTPTEVGGIEFFCEINSYEGHTANLTCAVDGDDDVYSDTAIFDLQGDNLLWIMDFSSNDPLPNGLKLTPCDRQ